MVNGLGSATFNELSSPMVRNSAITSGSNASANGQNVANQPQISSAFAQALSAKKSDITLDSKAVKVGELIEDFVEEMSEKFNLSPNQILQAVDLSDPKQLFLNPDQSAQKIADSLGLTPNEQNDALDSIKGFLSDMKKTLFSGESKQSTQLMAGLGGANILAGRKPVSEMSFFDVQSPLNRTLNKTSINENPFSQKKPDFNSDMSANFGSTKDAKISQQSLSNFGMNPFFGNSQNSSFDSNMVPGTELSAQQAGYQGVNQNQDQAQNAVITPSAFQAMAAGQDLVRPASTDSVLNQMNFESQLKESLANKSKLGGARGSQAYGIFGSATSPQNGASLYPSSVETLESLSEKENQDEGLEEWLKDSMGRENGFSQGAAQQKGTMSDFQKLLTNAGIATPGNMPDKIENMENMIEGARVMASKGGGQMDVELRPEGLGKVQLKVSVEDGQVQIQMLADNQKAQELLREGLDDLKSQLAHQKLNVDKISVDVSQDIGQQQDFARQNSSQDQQRQFAQGFMQQQRDERDQLRQGWSAIPASKRAEQARPNIQPAQVSQRSFDGRLNLVA